MWFHFLHAYFQFCRTLVLYSSVCNEVMLLAHAKTHRLSVFSIHAMQSTITQILFWFLISALVDRIRDLRHAVCRSRAWLRTHRHHQQLPHSDQVRRYNKTPLWWSLCLLMVLTYSPLNRSDSAILYNDRAVQENHHVSAAYRLMQDDDEMNILYNLSKDDWRLEPFGLDQEIFNTKNFTICNKYFSSS